MILITTQNGIYAWDESSQALIDFGLAGVDVCHVSSNYGDTIFAVDSSGNVLLKNGSAQWATVKINGLHDVISTIFTHPGTSEVYIGTEPPRLYRLQGENAHLVSDLTTLEGAEHWYTPYGAPPAVRSIAPAGKAGLYLNIHVGGVLRTLDGGMTWVAINSGLDLDVHQIFSSHANHSAIKSP
jgi:hypothetical protein